MERTNNNYLKVLCIFMQLHITFRSSGKLFINSQKSSRILILILLGE